MGTRINVIVGSNRKKSLVLFANSHHKDVDLEAIIRETASVSGTDEEFAERILNEVYPSDFGAHIKGMAIFTRDEEPGDHEKVFAVHGYSAPLAMVEFGSDFDWNSDEPLFI